MHSQSMDSGHIKSLLSPPSTDDAHKRAQEHLSVRFRTFQDVQTSEDFDEDVRIASQRNDELKQRVRYRIKPSDTYLMQLS